MLRGYHTHTIWDRWVLGRNARRGDPVCLPVSDDRYMVLYSGDLEHSATTTAAAVCFMPRFVTRNIYPLLPIYGLHDSTATAAVMGHHTPHARWLGAGR